MIGIVILIEHLMNWYVSITKKKYYIKKLTNNNNVFN